MSDSRTPVVRRMQVIPVAGHDGMLLNLSGAHGPFFTRNLVVLTDSAGRTGVGEVPGGEKIRQTLDDARPLIEAQPIGHVNRLLNAMRERFADRDSGGRGQGTDLLELIPRDQEQGAHGSGGMAVGLIVWRGSGCVPQGGVGLCIS